MRSRSTASAEGVAAGADGGAGGANSSGGQVGRVDDVLGREGHGGGHGLV